MKRYPNIRQFLVAICHNNSKHLTARRRKLLLKWKKKSLVDPQQSLFFPLITQNSYGKKILEGEWMCCTKPVDLLVAILNNSNWCKEEGKCNMSKSLPWCSSLKRLAAWDQHRVCGRNWRPAVICVDSAASLHRATHLRENEKTIPKVRVWARKKKKTCTSWSGPHSCVAMAISLECSLFVKCKCREIQMDKAAGICCTSAGR